MKIGVMVDSFRLDLERGLERAAAVGAQGVQIYVVEGGMAPENLSAGRRREILHRVRDLGLEVSALCGDLGGQGFTRPEEHAWKIEKSKRIVELAVDLETTVVTTHIGLVPADPAHPRRDVLRRACETIGRHGDRLGVRFAIETGPEPAPVLRGFLDGLDTRGIAVNLDPANLVMVLDADPAEAVRVLAPYIVHTHAKDGLHLLPTDPEVVYGLATAPPEGPGRKETFREVPLGEGGVDFDAYLAALRGIGYDGFLTVEREVGADPERDIRKAVAFLQERMGIPANG
jgi:L-ribulose-5-phosphate 3-epimerase